MPDGSMHSYHKEYHVTNLSELQSFLKQSCNPQGITTPGLTYCEFKLPKLLEYFSTLPSWSSDRKIMIYQPDLRAAELNLLFKYYKMWLAFGVDSMYGDNQQNWKQWKADCNHWSDLDLWQAREWFSFFYPGSVQEFIDAPGHVDDSWLVLTNLDILFDTESSMQRMIEFCGLEKIGDLGGFVTQWQAAQNYVVEEFELLDKIVRHSINCSDFTWQNLCFVSEAIVQRRLRDLGYDLRCHRLDQFPTNSIDLSDLLEKSTHA